MKISTARHFLTTSAFGALIACAAPSAVFAQDGEMAAETDEQAGDIVVTGTRIPRKDLTGTSPIAMTSGEQIKLDRALNVEDFSTKLPQLAGGVKSTSSGSDGRGAQTLDLRNLGQNRTLVLINGTRAVPFSFRNAVDVNAIPAPLIKRVDVLTGGAAAVYGADAVAGVVNFILDDEYKGAAFNTTVESARGGGTQYGGSLTLGGDIGDRGNIVAYVEYSQREALLAGKRPFALLRKNPIAAAGGTFTDIASGRIFSFDDAGTLQRTAQTSDYTSKYLLIQPLKRINATMLFKYDLFGDVEAYGRAMYSNVKTRGGPAGFDPLVVNEIVTINESNSFIPADARPLLTFAGGTAQVRVNRSLGELGIVTGETKRDTIQAQFGLRGPITSSIKWDVYGQFGRVTEDTTVTGDAIRLVPGSATGQTRFSTIANTADIFGPNGAGFDSFGDTFVRDIRKRDQINAGLTVSGDTDSFFSLPAGPIGFALGYEYRKEKGSINFDPSIRANLSFKQGGGVPFKGQFGVNELYGELLVPVLKDVPLIQKLEIEGAYRTSKYSNFGRFDTNKLGVNWEVSDDLRLRGTRQSVTRAPNIGEFAGALSNRPFGTFLTARPARYNGDPCALGTGNAEQCRRQGFVAPYNSLAAASFNPAGLYLFGGNDKIKPEKGRTYTIGGVFTPRFLPGFSATVDYYNIRITDAVGVIQPIDALTNCYITNPVAGNPLCDVVTRDKDPAFAGRLLNAFATDRNLGTIKQSGFDIGLTAKADLPDSVPGKNIVLQFQANIVTGYTFQKNVTVAPINCEGRYGAACSTDGVSLVAADFRSRTSLAWNFENVSANIGWQRIGAVRDSVPNSVGFIKAQDYIDLAISVTPTSWATVTVGVDNLFNKKPPLPINPDAFSTFTDTYNVIGRTFGLSLTIKR
jgi:iron complex outermembrane recepter protein